MPSPWQPMRSCITGIRSDPVSSMYRFEIPLRGMIARAWCSATLYDASGGQFQFLAQNPFLTQRLITLNAEIRSALRANRCPFIHDIDDLLWSIPADNWNAACVSPELLRNMETSLRLADLVTTSTEPLAAHLAKRGIAATVIPNLLDARDWQIQPQHTERTRLRVGWYGQQSVHVEDLNIIESVVCALAGEVDFVFYGDLPSGLAARRNEFEVYGQTTIELFPAMLAMLDLDVLLSPLAKNDFNECKSNLRPLQAGMLGYAVIATDIEPHRTLPVTLVANTPQAWVRALRDRIGEIDAVRAEGRELRSIVTQRFALDDAWTERIFTTWTGRRIPAAAA